MDNKTMVNNTTREADNGTDSSERADFISDGITTGIVVNTFLILLILGGNFLVIAAYFKNPRLRTGTYALLVSLALSDLLVGGVAIPIRIYGFINSWDVSVIFVLVYKAFDIFSAVASNLHLMAISFERFIAVLATVLSPNAPRPSVRGSVNNVLVLRDCRRLSASRKLFAKRR